MKSKLKPSLDETFAVGRLEGERETLEEIKTMILEKGVSNLNGLKVYIDARLKTVLNKTINDPFKQKRN